MTDVDATAPVTDAELDVFIQSCEEGISGRSNASGPSTPWSLSVGTELRTARARLAAYDAARKLATVEGVMKLAGQYGGHCNEVGYEGEYATPATCQSAEDAYDRLHDTITVIVADLDTRTSERDAARDERDEANAAVVALANEINVRGGTIRESGSKLDNLNAVIAAARKRKGTPT